MSKPDDIAAGIWKEAENLAMQYLAIDLALGFAAGAAMVLMAVAVLSKMGGI